LIKRHRIEAAWYDVIRPRAAQAAN
jgi:hypothetical protein